MDKRQDAVKSADNYLKYFRAVMLVAMAAAIIYLVVSNLAVVGNIVIVLLGFGAVIMIHEFGHFLLAKLSDINVETFSIGFPPALLGIKRTDKGYRFRLLPKTVKVEKQDTNSEDNNENKSDKEEFTEEAVLDFTLGKSKKPGETEYCIGMIPFGGFVKMLGQEDMGQAEKSDDPRSFANKPVRNRAAVIAAGVLFNAISAVLIFMVVFLAGVELPPPIVGDVIHSSPAHQAGIQPGDRIIEIDGKSKSLDFGTVMLASALGSEDQPMPLTIQRPDGTTEQFRLAPEYITPGDPLKSFGIEPAFTLKIANIAQDEVETLRERTGLLPGDTIRSVDGTDVDHLWEFEDIVARTYKSEVSVLVDRQGQNEQVDLDLILAFDLQKVERQGKPAHIHSMVPLLEVGDFPGRRDNPLSKGDVIIGIGEVAYPTYIELQGVIREYVDRPLEIELLRPNGDGYEQVTEVVKPRKQGERVVIGFMPIYHNRTPKLAGTVSQSNGPEKLDIPAGAIITAVNGRAVDNWYDIIDILQASAGTEVTLQYSVDDTVEEITFTPSDSPEAITAKSRITQIIPFAEMRELYRGDGPVNAIAMGLRQTQRIILTTYASLAALVSGQIGAGALSGPVGIVGMSYSVVAQRPFIDFVYFMGLISAAIAVFNFLPMAPLDGGLFVLLIVEKIKGSALSARVQTIILYMGWAIILPLILYVTYNDILNLIRGWLS